MIGKKNNALRAVALCVAVVIIVIAPFFAVFLTGVLLPPVYSDTYYGALPLLYERLEAASGKKIVTIGNSSVAFGVDSALAERLLGEAGLDYSVCNFGLYGALGTRMMCELARDSIDKDDIVILSPELVPQSLSLYFSAEEAWYALDGNMKMFDRFPSDLKRSLVGGFFAYAADKLEMNRSGKKAEPSGIYARASFDDRGDLKNYDRPYNIMDGGANVGAIKLDAELFAGEFVDYLNSYARDMTKRGATVYYSFAPMNLYALSADDAARADEFYDAVVEKLDFDVINDINDCIMDGEWFYDSDFHLNESGMTVNTVRLVNDIKNALGNTTKTDFALPDKPKAPEPDVEGEGDNTHADMFEYRLDGSYYTVVGLTDAGRAATELTIPYQVDGIYVKAFLPFVFFDNKNIRSVTIQPNIHALPNGSFIGCDRLEKIILEHAEPADISVGYELLDGVPDGCKVCVPQGSLSKFANNYFWGRYARRLQGY